MKGDKKKVSPEFKDHPELGSLFLSADRNILSLVSRLQAPTGHEYSQNWETKVDFSHRGKITAL